MIPTEEMWARFCKAIGREDLTRHPRLSSGPLRAQNYDALLRPVLDEWMAGKTNQEALQVLLRHGVPAGPSQTARDLVHCPQLSTRKMIVDIEDPVGGKKKFVGSPVKLSGVPEVEPRRAPFLGEHSQEILEGLLGISRDKIAELRTEKVI
jgi:crotonobetainyl-CoA:carnitine CoA-transferase CaiB-like acyl-CoA transferase